MQHMPLEASDRSYQSGHAFVIDMVVAEGGGIVRKFGIELHERRNTLSQTKPCTHDGKYAHDMHPRRWFRR